MSQIYCWFERIRPGNQGRDKLGSHRLRIWGLGVRLLSGAPIFQGLRKTSKRRQQRQQPINNQPERLRRAEMAGMRRQPRAHQVELTGADRAEGGSKGGGVLTASRPAPANYWPPHS
jgi:hypothetical protein